MSYTNLLRETAEKNNSIVCMGIDPVEEKIPLDLPIEQKLVTFYQGILDAMLGEDTKPACIKPNIAFFTVKVQSSGEATFFTR